RDNLKKLSSYKHKKRVLYRSNYSSYLQYMLLELAQYNSLLLRFHWASFLHLFGYDISYFCTFIFFFSSSQHSVFFKPLIDEAWKVGLSPIFLWVVKSCNTLKAAPPNNAITNKLIIAIKPINKSAIDQTISTVANAPNITIASTSKRYVTNHDLCAFINSIFVSP